MTDPYDIEGELRARTGLDYDRLYLTQGIVRELADVETVDLAHLLVKVIASFAVLEGRVLNLEDAAGSAGQQPGWPGFLAFISHSLQTLARRGGVGQRLRPVEQVVDLAPIGGAAQVEAVPDRLLLGARVLPPQAGEVEQVALEVRQWHGWSVTQWCDGHGHSRLGPGVRAARNAT